MPDQDSKPNQGQFTSAQSNGDTTKQKTDSSNIGNQTSSKPNSSTKVDIDTSDSSDSSMVLVKVTFDDFSLKNFQDPKQRDAFKSFCLRKSTNSKIDFNDESILEKIRKEFLGIK